MKKVRTNTNTVVVAYHHFHCHQYFNCPPLPGSQYYGHGHDVSFTFGRDRGGGQSVHTKELVSYEQKKQKTQILFMAQLFEKKESRTDFQ